MNPETLPRFFYEDMDMHGRKENFMQYISDRPGAVHVDGTPHGLFSDRGLDINLEQVMDEVANHRGTVWINVISLKREDAKQLHFDQVEQWQRLLRNHVADISEAFKISPSGLKIYLTMAILSYKSELLDFHYVTVYLKSKQSVVIRLIHGF